MPHDHTEQGKVQIIYLFFANNLANGHNWGCEYQGVLTELKEIGETNSYILGKGPDISARQGLYICNLPLLSLNLFRLVSRLGFLHNGDNQLY